jgi:lipoprotein signal peptidase
MEPETLEHFLLGCNVLAETPEPYVSVDHFFPSWILPVNYGTALYVILQEQILCFCILLSALYAVYIRYQCQNKHDDILQK